MPLNADALAGGNYLVDWMQVRYVRNSGLMAIPTASASPTLVRLHQPISLKIVTFEKVRTESQPDYPHPDQTSDAGATLLFDDVQIATPGMLANLVSRVYAVRGVYVYSLADPRGGGSDLQYGLLAMETGSPAGRYDARRAKRLT